MAAVAPFIGPAIGAAASLYGGLSAMQQANYQAEVAKNNARIAEMNAVRASTVGGIEAQMKDLEFRQLMGQQITEQAASGVSLSGSSQIRARNATRLFAAGDRQTITENAQMENYNYRVEAVNQRSAAKAAKAEGKAAMIGGILGAAGAIAGGDFTAMKKSLVGGSKSTQKIPIPTARPPGLGRPIPKPRLRPTIGTSTNPLLRRNMGH